MTSSRLSPALRLGLCAALLALAAAAQAETRPMTMTAPQNVLQLAAQGSVEVRQDLLMLTLSADREGACARHWTPPCQKTEKPPNLSKWTCKRANSA